MKITFTLLTFLLSFIFSSAQITFQTTIGGSLSDYGNSVRQAADGGYMIAGTHTGDSTTDVYLIKTDASGNLLLTRTYDTFHDEEAYYLEETPDSGFIVAASTYSDSINGYVIKTNNTGNANWFKVQFNDPSHVCHSVVPTYDGGYVTTGMTFNGGVSFFDPYIVKYDAAGNMLWEKVYAVFASFDDDFGYSIRETSDSGFIVAGYTRNFGAGEQDALLIKTDSLANIIWQNSYGGSDTEFVYSNVQTTDDGFIMTGYTKSFGAGMQDVYVVRTLSNGSLAWSMTYGGAGADFGKSIQQAADGGFIIAGYTESFGSGLKDVYVIKIDSSGIVEWSKAIGGALNDEGMSVQQTSDGGYIVTGYTESFGSGLQDVYLIKLDSAGNSGCNETNAATIADTATTQLTAAGFIASNAVTIINLSTALDSAGSETLLCTVGVNESVESNSITIYPNPAHNTFTISLNEEFKKQNAEFKIFDVTGRVVYEQGIINHKSEIRNCSFSPGLYFVIVTAGKSRLVQTEKLMIE
jgi:hypothetical protein